MWMTLPNVSVVNTDHCYHSQVYLARTRCTKMINHYTTGYFAAISYDRVHFFPPKLSRIKHSFIPLQLIDGQASEKEWPMANWNCKSCHIFPLPHRSHPVNHCDWCYSRCNLCMCGLANWRLWWTWCMLGVWSYQIPSLLHGFQRCHVLLKYRFLHPNLVFLAKSTNWREWKLM